VNVADNKNLYQVIGVAENASAIDIKRAYRRLAKDFHPDVTGGDKTKEARFKEITAAYEVLGDEKKRADYDQKRKNPWANASPFAGGGFPGAGARAAGPRGRRVDMDFRDLTDLFNKAGSAGAGESTGGGGFGDLFSELFRGGSSASRSAGPKRQGLDVQSHIEVDFATAALGGEVPVVSDGKHWNVKVPPGIESGQTIRLTGKGQPGGVGAPPGDLLLAVTVRPHPQLRRRGDDLEVDVPIGIDQAVLGAKVDVPTIEGHAQVTIPAGTSSGLRLRLRGKGVRKKAPVDGEPDTRGDQYAIIQIAVPKDLPPRARELIEEFALLTKRK
jgi:DnaJ-class molecular chaperone